MRLAIRVAGVVCLAALLLALLLVGNHEFGLHIPAVVIVMPTALGLAIVFRRLMDRSR